MFEKIIRLNPIKCLWSYPRGFFYSEKLGFTYVIVKPNLESPEWSPSNYYTYVKLKPEADPDVKDTCDYKYSSARYYELEEKNFPFLKDLWEVG